MKKKNYEQMKEEISVKNVRSDSNLVLSSVPDQINFPKKEPGSSTQCPKRNSALCILYSGQIVYGSGSLSKVMNTQAKSIGSQEK